jgi:hypothetical protein
MKIDNINELAVVARALRLHDLMNRLGYGYIAGDVHDDVTVERMALKAETALRQAIEPYEDDDGWHDEHDILDWYWGNVDFTAIECAVLDRAACLPDEVHADIGDLYQRGDYSREDIKVLANKTVEIEKAWLRTDEGKEWINE